MRVPTMLFDRRCVGLVVLVLLMGCGGASSGTSLDEACDRFTHSTEGGPSPEVRFEADASADPEARAEVEAYYRRVNGALAQYLTELEDLAPEGREAEWREALDAAREPGEGSFASLVAGTDDGTTEILSEYGVADCVLEATRVG